MRSRIGSVVAVVVLVALVLVPVAERGRAWSQATPTTDATPAVVGTPDAGGTPVAGAAPAIDLDVLFIGAHPDDEAFALATYGQWNEDFGVTTGVITITRGEGGGNAVGTEEGPALGLLREGEERRAVGGVGIANIYNLDKVDFYYTVSAPLTEEIWGAEETLEKVVRVVRTTRPDVITTMNPSPTPGNHGHHQMAARFAIEAFYAAADPTVFPEQIQEEGLQPWQVKKIFRGGFAGEAPDGPVCASTFVPAEPTDLVYGVWSGRPSARNNGRSWAEVERDGQRQYVSQGWAVFPDVETDPTALPCDFFTLVDSRVPFSIENADPTAIVEGALVPAAGGLPLGTEFYLSADRFDLVPGQSFTVTAHASSAAMPAEGTVQLSLPAGWTAEGDGALAAGADGEMTTEFAVTVGASVAVDTRTRLVATLSAGGMQGTTAEVVRVVPTVRGTLEPLPQVAQFRAWAARVGVPQLDSLIAPLLSLGVGETRPIRVDLENLGETAQDGSVALALPDGFSADAASLPFSGLVPGAPAEVTFQVTNTDPALATANEGGDYPLGITTTSGATSGTQQAGLNLVPVTTIPQAATAPTVDGAEGPGEYAGAALDLSRVWEGDDPDSPADASGSTKVTWAGDDLYLLVNVVDETLGTVLPTADAKRHWRTDSVEIAIDPRGTGENTSTTFKVGVFPTTADTAEAAAYRDADARQGPVAETAPGLEVASRLTEPYAGYTLEVKIPLSAVPAAVDPQRMTLNVFIYDSDTQDKTGQTRLGWSTWNGVQGDPYRWGRAILEGYAPPADRPTAPGAAVLPLEPTRSVTSPQSILQAATDGVALAGDPTAAAGVEIASGPSVAATGLTLGLQAAGPGTAHVFLWDGETAIAEQTVEVTAGQISTVELPVDEATRSAMTAGGGLVLVGFEAATGGTVSLMAPLDG